MRTVKERIESKVTKCGTQECWPWRGAVETQGYPSVWTKFGNRRGHRLLYEMHHGPIPSGAVVRHLCGNKLCMNAEHLAIGTPRDNWDDSVRHGTVHMVVPKGCEEHPNALLSNDDVIEYRDLYGSGLRVIDIVRRTGRKYSTVWAAVHGQNFSALATKQKEEKTHGDDRNRDPRSP